MKEKLKKANELINKMELTGRQKDAVKTLCKAILDEDFQIERIETFSIGDIIEVLYPDGDEWDDYLIYYEKKTPGEVVSVQCLNGLISPGIDTPMTVINANRISYEEMEKLLRVDKGYKFRKKVKK